MTLNNFDFDIGSDLLPNFPMIKARGVEPKIFDLPFIIEISFLNPILGGIAAILTAYECKRTQEFYNEYNNDTSS